MSYLLRKAAAMAASSGLAARAAARFMAPGVPVFMMHRVHHWSLNIGGHAPPQVQRYFDYLRTHGYELLPLERIVDDLESGTQLPERAVAFTIDDGFQDQLELLVPMFEQEGVPVSMFLITGLVDGNLWPWDDKVAWIIWSSPCSQIDVTVAGHRLRFPLDTADARRRARRDLWMRLKVLPANEVPAAMVALAQAAKVICPEQAPREFAPVTWQQVTAAESDLVRFGPHSLSHRILSRLDDAEAEQEIVGSWQRLSEHVQQPLPVFCYPTGRTQDFTSREIVTVRDTLGLRAALASEGGQVTSKSDLYALPRFQLPNTLDEFKLCLTWFERWRQAADDHAA